jgi:biopolymer transport protein ExbD
MRGAWMMGMAATLCVACEPTKAPYTDAPPVVSANPPAVVASVVVGIDSNGRFFWNGEEVSLEELERRARAAAGTPTELDVIADGKPDFEQFKRLIDVLEPTGLLKKAYVVGGT